MLCPAGKRSERWQPSRDPYGNGMIVITFSSEDCQGCALRARCTKATTGGRGLSVRPREQHVALQAARVYQETEEFWMKYKRRAGGRRDLYPGKSPLGERDARYIGLAKTHSQHLLTAIALNLLRLMTWLAEVPRAETRTSPFAALMARRRHKWRTVQVRQQYQRITNSSPPKRAANLRSGYGAARYRQCPSERCLRPDAHTCC